LIFQDVIIRGKCAKRKGGLLLLKMFLDICLKEFFSNHVIETSMKMIEVEGSVAIFPPEHSGNYGVLKSTTKNGPLVTESGHILDTFFMFLLEQCEGGGLV